MSGYLLSLDLATSIGWTCGHPDDEHFAYGTHRLPKTGADIGLFLEAYRTWLQTALEGVSIVVFESPILIRHTSLATARKLYSQSGLTELICRDRGVEYRECHLMSVKKFMGSGSYKKPQMIDAVKRFGYDPKTDDEADAIALRLFALHQLFPSAKRTFNLDMGQLGAAA